MCPTSDGIEDMEHFLLLCPSLDLQRRDLLAGIVELLRPFVQITNLSNDALIQLLLYGDLSYDLNGNIQVIPNKHNRWMSGDILKSPSNFNHGNPCI